MKLARILSLSLSLGAVSLPALADDLTMLGGPVGGGWYAVAGGISEIVHTAAPDLTIKVAPGGAVVNPARVSTGDAAFAMSVGVNNGMAWEGSEPYEEKYQNIRAIVGGFNVNVFQVVAREDFPLDDVGSLFTSGRGTKITSPGLQTMTGYTIRKIFEHYNTSIDELKSKGGAYYQANHSKQADYLRDGQAEVIMTMLAIPSANILEVSTVRQLKLLPFPQDLVDVMTTKLGYQAFMIPKETYKDTIKLDADVPTIAVDSGIIARADVPDEVVYQFVKALMENTDKVKAIHKAMASFEPEEIVKAKYRGKLPLHPGAERYFKEKGLNYQ
jgi:TRAP transporter TAXI family solute receptor